MDKLRIHLALPLAMSVLGVALAGCGGPPPVSGTNGTSAPNDSAAPTAGGTAEPPSKPGRYGGTFTEATISDPKTFNYWVSSDNASTTSVAPLLEALNARNAYTLQFEPRLADLPQISADGLTYTYTLREGLVWSDGHPITADDVVFTLDVLFDQKIETIAREGMMVDVTQPDGTVKREPFKYRKVDDRTIEFKLPAKYAPAMDIFSFVIAPKHKLEAAYKSGKFNSTWGINTPPSELVSSSAWLMKEYVPQQRIVYVRNPKFFLKSDDGKPLPYLDEYRVLIVPEISTTTLKFRNHETDTLAVQAPDYPSIKKDEAGGDYTVINRGPGWGFNYLGFNLNPNSKVNKTLVKLFQDMRFRQAVSHAVNRQRMVDDIFRGLARPLYGPVSPANTVFFKEDIPKFEYDLEKAKAKLAEIGLKDTNGNGILEFEGKDVKFNILTNTENELRKSMATIITNDLKKIGIGATFVPITFTDLVRRLDSPPYDWEASILGFTGGPEPHNGSNIWRSSGPSHQWWPKQKTPATPWEAEIDKLWTQGAQELDPVKRKAIYDRWQEIAGEQQPFNFTVVTDQITAVRKHFGNIKPSSLGGVTWNLEEVYDTEATRDTP
jgi:peptide/nickel transport system substrate-binding protein